MHTLRSASTRAKGEQEGECKDKVEKGGARAKVRAKNRGGHKGEGEERSACVRARRGG